MQFEKPDVERILVVANDITSKVSNCWVMTADPSGGVNARVVQPIFSRLDQVGGVVRFLTSSKSRKAVEITKCRRVSLGYQYDAEQAYVTLVGDAHIINDRDYLKDKWQTEWNLFFPAGPSDLDAVIVEVTVEHIEIWNLARRIAGAPNGLRAAILERVASGWQLG